MRRRISPSALITYRIAFNLRACVNIVVGVIFQSLDNSSAVYPRFFGKDNMRVFAEEAGRVFEIMRSSVKAIPRGGGEVEGDADGMGDKGSFSKRSLNVDLGIPASRAAAEKLPLCLSSSFWRVMR